MNIDEFITQSDFKKHERSMDYLLLCGAGGEIEIKTYLDLLRSGLKQKKK